MNNDPITDIIFISSLSKAPPNFTVITRTTDTHDDADLGKEGIFRKSARYLAYSKTSFNPSAPPEVLVELIIINDKDPIRSTFKAIEKTIDTREKCLKRKVLCARFEPWSPNLKVITDLHIFSRAGDGLAGNIYIGELSSQHILTCIVSSLAEPFSSQKKSKAPLPVPVGQSALGDSGSTFRSITSPLNGVPFELTRNFLRNFDDLQMLLSCHPKSPETINEEYSYNFSLESSLTGG